MSEKEYVKIDRIWQKTDCAWFIDKAKLNYSFMGGSFKDYETVAHVHHWKTKLEEYSKIDEYWKCLRCGEEILDSIKSMIKLYKPLKDV